MKKSMKESISKTTARPASQKSTARRTQTNTTAVRSHTQSAKVGNQKLYTMSRHEVRHLWELYSMFGEVFLQAESRLK